MKALLVKPTKLAAYFLWEETKYDNALSHWYCAEDIACFLEDAAILNPDDILLIIKKGIYDLSYIHFVRNIAFRIYIYSNKCDGLKNWFIAERLLANREWCAAITDIAKIYNTEKDKSEFISTIRSDKVRNFYRL